MITSKQIRSGFIDFFKQHQHEFVPSSPIVPVNDNTILFANAGMNQFKDIFMGLTVPKFKRAANSQKCLRVSGKHNDLEEVGKDTYHHTFFEMLGNWSFGDYFKAEAIEWAWQLLTKVWQINPDLLWATVFGGDKHDNSEPDNTAKNLWPKVTTIPAERVLFFGKKDNFWEMGETGPCGPCSEIHIDLGPERCDMKNVPGHICRVNNGCARFMELWNLVFIQFNRQPDGRLLPLSANHVDTGAGLERVVSVLQKKNSNYDTDLFMPIINSVSDISGHKYTSQLHNTTDNAFRVIADHIRAIVFAITDGATPSNDGRGYVIRRILRRAARFGRELDMHEPFLHRLVPVLVDNMGQAFPEIRDRAEHVSTVIESEETSFGRTLDRGIDIFNSVAEKAQKSGKKNINGEDAFQLYDTYGFPLDLTQLMAAEKGLTVDASKFQELMNQQKERARAAQKGASLAVTLADAELPVTEDLHKYHTDSCRSQVLGWIDNEGFKTSGRIEAGQEVGIVLDKTCFYAESGGQVGDCGIIESASAKFVVESTAKIADCVIHRGKMAEGSIQPADTVIAIVSKDRNAIKKNHTATHLLQWALQQEVGKNVHQQGSLVGPDYLRFDFTCPKALTAEQIKNVESIIREKIDQDLPVNCVTMPKEDAEKLGAMALFGEKYANEVRVVAIGSETDKKINEAFSKEFCGGTHLDKIGAIGGFKIVKEESISAGIRRITALTGSGLTKYLEQRSGIVDMISEILKAPAEELPDRVTKLIEDNKKLSRQLKNASKQTGSDIMTQAKQMLDNAQTIGETVIITAQLQSATIDQARDAVDMLKKKAVSAAVVFGFEDEGKAVLIAGVTDDLVKKGLKAGDIVKQIAPIVDGGGGGKPQMAQAGGKNPAKINDAVAKAEEIIKAALT